MFWLFGPLVRDIKANGFISRQATLSFSLSSPLAGKRDIVVTFLVRCLCVHPSGFVRTITCTIMHGFQNNLA